MKRKYNDRYVTSIPFEKSTYDRINELLPKGITIADELNEFLKERLTDLEKDLIVRGTNTNFNKGPVRIFKNADSSSILEQTIEPTLNIYCTTQSLVNHVREITDPQIAWALKRKAVLLNTLADTRAKQLTEEHK